MAYCRLQQLGEEDFGKIKNICVKTSEKVFGKVKERHIKKFNQLRQRQTTTATYSNISLKDPMKLHLRPSWVVNLSNKNLTNTEEMILSKGPSYAITQKINKIDIVTPIGSALKFSTANGYRPSKRDHTHKYMPSDTKSKKTAEQSK